MTQDIDCAVNCVQSAWTNSGTCSKSCGTGKQSQTRTTTTTAKNGGTVCGSETREINCNTQACAVNCVQSAWENDGGCSKSCGTGKQKQKRTTTTAAVGTGTACGSLTREINCNTQTCTVNDEYPPPYTAKSVRIGNSYQWQITDSNGVEPPNARRDYLIHYTYTETWVFARSYSSDRTVTWSNPSSTSFSLGDGTFEI